MEAGKSISLLMEQLDCWVTKKAMVTLTGVTISQPQRWDSQLFTWSSKQLVSRSGNGPATVTLYHPLCVPMVQRLLEIKKTEPRTFEEWRWQLWLDGYPISVRAYCINAIVEARKRAILTGRGRYS